MRFSLRRKVDNSVAAVELVFADVGIDSPARRRHRWHQSHVAEEEHRRRRPGARLILRLYRRQHPVRAKLANNLDSVFSRLCIWSIKVLSYMFLSSYGSEAFRVDIIEAAKKANVHGFISNLTDGYDTLVGERYLLTCSQSLCNVYSALYRSQLSTRFAYFT